VRIELVNAEILTVGPDETLLVKLGEKLTPEQVDLALKSFEGAGIRRDRVVILQGDVELAKVKP
jgi:hypothetical protein